MPQRIWHVNTTKKHLYLTFDDGPDPDITPVILDTLSDFSAKVTFFHLGSKVLEHPNLSDLCRHHQHCIGNHGFHHLDGWNCRIKTYYENIEKGSEVINSRLYRPPYGRLPFWNRRSISEENTIVMWDVMPGDFDPNVNENKCFDNVINHVSPGSIVVLHENELSAKNVKKILPRILEFYSERGYTFKSLKEENSERTTKSGFKRTL